jgi:hypothetical protein
MIRSAVRRFARGLLVLVLGALLGVGLGWVLASRRSETDLQRVVAMSWGDGAYGKAFYGAHVYLEPVSGGYSVQARVYIGRGDGAYFHDIGELGRVATAEEAVARWGRVEWSEDGLRLGEGEGSFFLPRAALERHR